MSRVYVIADPHFGHKNLAINLRKFQSVEEHDNLIINNWNKVVNEKDTVYILGDLTMEKDLYEQYLPKLNGIINAVLGNHDMPKHVPSLLRYVNKVMGMYDYKGGTLTHCPIHPIELQSGRLLFNIHGHIHTEKIDNPKYICVSCEQINYTPVLIESLIFNKNE